MTDDAQLSLLFFLVPPLILLPLGYISGRIAERRHYASIRTREQRFRKQPAISTKGWETKQTVATATLATGSVVVSIDYMKAFLAALRLLIGGELLAYAPLLERGRREALLRMKESCPNANAYVNCRMETSAISRSQQNGMGCVEVVAYATAITYTL